MARRQLQALGNGIRNTGRAVIGDADLRGIVFGPLIALGTYTAGNVVDGVVGGNIGEIVNYGSDVAAPVLAGAYMTSQMGARDDNNYHFLRGIGVSIIGGIAGLLVGDTTGNYAGNIGGLDMIKNGVQLITMGEPEIGGAIVGAAVPPAKWTIDGLMGRQVAPRYTADEIAGGFVDPADP